MSFTSRFGASGGGGGQSFTRSNFDFQFQNYGQQQQQANYSDVPIQKFNYQEHPNTLNRSPGELSYWFEKNVVTVKGQMPNPILKFDETNFPAAIVANLFKNYSEPTTIQSITWPVALSGNDLISIAKTGSGKTLGFILPGIIHVKNQAPRERGDGPIVVVMLPTRELAIQVEEVAREYGEPMGLSVCCCYGGAPRGTQALKMRRGVDICVATPGRLNDFLNDRTTSMNRCSFLVLDEADRMLDMGFEPQIRQIVQQTRPDRQTLMFSATWPREVRSLAADFHTNPVHLTVGSLDLAANHNIKQFVEVLEEWDKEGKLFEVLEMVLKEDPKSRILIFTETKRKADTLVSTMRRNGVPALCIHGDKEQREREWVLAEFRAAKQNILVATDVAARGLDVDDIKYVINFDYPKNSEDYVHRIGRTGRRDRQGTSITFFTPNDVPKARDLIKVLEEAKQIVPPDLAGLANGSYLPSGGRSRYGGGGGTGANRAPVGGGANFGGSNYGGGRTTFGGGNGGGVSMEWVHCNICYGTPSQGTKQYWFSSCGHLYCWNCLKGKNQKFDGSACAQQCAVCNKNTQIVPVNRQMKGNLMEFFRPPKELIAEFAGRINQVMEFQNQQKKHMGDHLFKKTQHAAKCMKMAKAEVLKWKEKEQKAVSERDKLKAELEKADEWGRELQKTLTNSANQRQQQYHYQQQQFGHSSQARCSVTPAANMHSNRSFSGRHVARSLSTSLYCGAPPPGFAHTVQYPASSSRHYPPYSPFYGSNASVSSKSSTPLQPGRITKGPVLPPSFSIHNNNHTDTDSFGV